MIGKPTHTTEVALQFEGLARLDLATKFTFIPDNKQDIREGYYRHDALVKLLRSAALSKDNDAVRDRVLFIADMME